MDVSRRTVISGGILGALTAGAIGYSQGIFESYKSYIWVDNRRETTVTVDLELSNRDAGRTVIEESLTLGPGDDFQKRDVLSNGTTYLMTVQTDGNSVEREFDACCRGYTVNVHVEQDKTQIFLGHYD